MQAIKIIAPGGYTTIQDRGRFGFQNMGVPVSGVLDPFAFAAANLLAGNPANTPVLELTVMGPSMEILAPMDLALAGAAMEIKVNDTPVPQWQSFRVQAGDRVSIGQVTSGCRACLALGGGPDLTRIMGSCSTYVGAGLGGFNGRPLKAGDILETHEAVPLARPRALPADQIPEYGSDIRLRAVPGPQDDYFDQGLEALFATPYMVTPKADRMGYRLMGEKIAIKKGMPQSIVSEPSVPGAIQIPADQQPIILLVEQTVGGYAKIATVISSDIGRVAQATPGDMVRFEKIHLETAHAIYRDEKKRLARLTDLF